MTVNSEQALLCPYRDDIKKVAGSLPRIEKKLKEIHERLFVKINGDPLSVEVDKNTEFREKIETEGVFKKRNKWSRYRLWIAVMTLLLATIFNSVMIIIR